MIGVPVRRPRRKPESASQLTQFKMSAQLRRAHVVGLLVDFNELGECASLGDGFGRGNESIGHRENRVARLHSACNQREAQRVGSAGHADAFRGSGIGGKCSSKFVNAGRR